ncbi:MAG: hypothetical protein ACE5EI_06520 [Thermodesulfobacteriota bacterium]
MKAVSMGNRLKDPSPTGLRLTKRPLGRVLVEGGFISPGELEAGLAEQAKTGETLGTILVARGALSRRDLKAALSAQTRLASLDDALQAVSGQGRMLGELLTLANRVSAGELREALEEHSRTGKMLGEVLTSRGLITADELEAVLAFQRNLRCKATSGSGFRLGELLVATDHITCEQLQDALHRQRASRKKLGTVLVEAGYAEKRHIDYALKLQRKLLAAALASVISYAAVRDAAAGTDATVESASPDVSISVMASVRPLATLKVLNQPGEVVITYADITRGYVDVTAPSRLQVRNNSPAGYLMVFEYSDWAFSEVRVMGLGTDVVFRSGASWVARPYVGKGPSIVELRYRFLLSKNIEPGTYAWPVKTSVEPL